MGLERKESSLIIERKSKGIANIGMCFYVQFSIEGIEYGGGKS